MILVQETGFTAGDRIQFRRQGSLQEIGFQSRRQDSGAGVCSQIQGTGIREA
jgi:hypothetical protein